MHTIWMREHNRLAELLKNRHPNWDDEKLYQEARRIVIAEYQHIIYNEWLPIILGSKLMKHHKLSPLSSGYSDHYEGGDFDPRITNEFAGAAFRFGHSLIPSNFQSINKQKWSQQKTSKQRLRDIFFEPQQFTRNPGMYIYNIMNHKLP